MKTLLIFPPQWSPLSPHLALTSLYSHLKDKGYSVNIRDLNVEYYHYVTQPENILKSLSNAFSQEQDLINFISSEYSPDKKEEDYSNEFQVNAKKLVKIKELKEKKNEVKEVLNLINSAINIMRSENDFYNLESFIKSLYIIDKALSYISLPYYPAEFSLHDYTNPSMKFNYKELKKYCLDKSLNMFYDFYEKELETLINENANYIGISIGAYSQVIPGLTLAMLLKQNTKAHINIGGNYFSRMPEAFKNHPEFFEIFADSILIEEGENPIVKLIDHVEGKLPIEKVSNLIYLDKNNQVKINPNTVPIRLNDMAVQDLSAIPKELYLMPEIVLPIHSSRGCYWKKCTFCDHDFGQTYNVKDVGKLIREIKEINEKFGITHFEFVDEAINANYLRAFSERLIESGLQINWYCNARLESNLTADIFKLARKAGLRMILWGFESGSNKIMELINKGIDLDKRLEILKNAAEADIWNFAYIFFGFPTETEKEAMETVNIISENTDIINAYGRSTFTLGRHALIKDDPSKFGITKFSQNEEEFSSNCSYSCDCALNAKELNEIAEILNKKAMEKYNNPSWMYIRYRETLFLYICKYGADALKSKTGIGLNTIFK